MINFVDVRRAVIKYQAAGALSRPDTAAQNERTPEEVLQLYAIDNADSPHTLAHTSGHNENHLRYATDNHTHSNEAAY